ncbi:hypothetical protein BU23DRAFT_461388, partial [Bimuria novae-zelandiae CBS 107.79]
IEDPNRAAKGGTSKINAYGMADLLEIERWPEYNAAEHRPAESKQPVDQQDFFACYLCLKIRSASKFSNAMMKGKRGKLGTGSEAEKIGRFCITCGIAHGRYQRGIRIQFRGAFGGHGFVCRSCGNFEQEAQRACTSCWRHGHRILEPVFDPFYISIDCSDWRDIFL